MLSVPSSCSLGASAAECGGQLRKPLVLALSGNGFLSPGREEPHHKRGPLRRWRFPGLSPLVRAGGPAALMTKACRPAGQRQK